jgi:hypothetical protein
MHAVSSSALLLTVLLNVLDFARRSLPMLPRLIDERSG